MKKRNLVFFIQLVFTIVTLVFLIMFIFNKKFLYLLQIALGITTIITGYNHFLTHKKKNISIMYFIIGLVLLILAVITIIGF